MISVMAFMCTLIGIGLAIYGGRTNRERLVQAGGIGALISFVVMVISILVR